MEIKLNLLKSLLLSNENFVDNLLSLNKKGKVIFESLTNCAIEYDILMKNNTKDNLFKNANNIHKIFLENKTEKILINLQEIFKKYSEIQSFFHKNINNIENIIENDIKINNINEDNRNKISIIVLLIKISENIDFMFEKEKEIKGLMISHIEKIIKSKEIGINKENFEYYLQIWVYNPFLKDNEIKSLRNLLKKI